MVAEPTLLLCPHCELPLNRQSADYYCARAHTFPIAREGYVNLLGRSLIGDTTPMLAARRRFLDAGYFLPIANALAAGFVQHAPSHLFAPSVLSTSPVGIFDAGCGEGYYLGHVQRALAATRLPITLGYYGFDSAKVAVKLAARRYPEATFFVGDITRRWNVSTGANCAILNVFAPRNFSEFARVLQRNGLLLTIIPTQQHFCEMRDVYELLNIEQQKEARIRAQAKPWFSLLHLQTVEYQQLFTHSAIVDAVTMSPNYWHQPQVLDSATDDASALSVTVSIQLLIFQRE